MYARIGAAVALGTFLCLYNTYVRRFSNSRDSSLDGPTGFPKADTLELLQTAIAAIQKGGRRAASSM
jgi:hypothetical protein